MDMLLQRLVEMNLYGSLAILLVMLFRLLFRRMPKKIMVFFWIIVAVRLLCPFNFNSSLSLMNFIPSFEKTQTQKQTQNIEHGEGVVIISEQEVKDVAFDHEYTKAEVSAPKEPSFRLEAADVAVIVWAAGTVALLTYAGVRYVKVRRFVGGLRATPDNLYLETDKTDTPFVAGIIKPKICVPSFFEEDEKEYLMLHEKTHIKNHDGIIKTLGFLIVCIHWFNPLVWISYIMLCSDLEMRCDEEVIEILGKDIKKDYCRSIVFHSVKAPIVMPGSSAFGGAGLGSLEVRMRINNLIKHKKISQKISILALCLALGIISVMTAYKKELSALPDDGSPEEVTSEDTDYEEPSTSEETGEDEQEEETEETELPDVNGNSVVSDLSDNTDDKCRKPAETLSYDEQSAIILADYEELAPALFDKAAELAEEYENNGYTLYGETINHSVQKDVKIELFFVKDDELVSVKIHEDGSYEVGNDEFDDGITVQYNPFSAGYDGAYDNMYVSSQ